MTILMKTERLFLFQSGPVPTGTESIFWMRRWVGLCEFSGKKIRQSAGVFVILLFLRSEVDGF